MLIGTLEINRNNNYSRQLLFLSSCLLSLGIISPAKTQIITDNSLGAESSIITPQDVSWDLIEGGAIRDNNLFHSFSEFNVNDGARVDFANPEGIVNILTRVTGNNISEIFGTLGVDGGANLFLLNPNGIVFGENAALDINSSFLATTADSYIFENGFAYSASNPEVPPLLTINIPIGLQFGDRAEVIVNQSFHSNNFDEFVGLEVAPANNITLIGGDILFDGGLITAPNGFIEIGSIAPNNFVKIIPTENNWTLDYSGIASFQDINLTQAASISSSGDGGGNIQLQGKQITLQDGSTISADSYGEDSAGILRINATEKLEILGTNEGEEPFALSAVSTDAFSSGQGNDMEIKTQQLFIREGGIVRAEVFDTGKGGNISIQAKNIALTTTTFPFSIISTQVNDEGTGQGGNISIEADDILLQNSIIYADSYGSGNTGNITFDVEQLRLLEGSQIATGTFGNGQGGNIALQAKKIEIDGIDAEGFPSGLFSTSAGNGDGGDITINAQKLTVSDRALIDASNVAGMGNSGDIEINVQQLVLEKNAPQIATATVGQGDGGNLIIRATESIDISGTELRSGSEEGEDSTIFFGGLFATVEFGATGKGGNLIIETNNLNLFDGGAIVASTFGEGNAGDILIRTNNLEVRDTVIDLDLTRSGINSTVESQGVGNGGHIEIITNNLSLIDGGSIAADSLGEGDAGTINVQAQNITISGTSSDEPVWGIEQESLPSSISTFSSGDFAAGSININTNNLDIDNQAGISVSNSGQGNSGTLNINAQDLFINNLGRITAEVNGGEQGNINLRTNNILLRNSNISTEATGVSTGGNITINSSETLAVLENSSIIANAIAGNGGNIEITTQGLFVSADSLITASSQFGLDGEINIDNLNGDRFLELNPLPNNFIDAAEQIITSCLADTNQFAIAGQGGLPENPRQYLRGQTVWQDLRLLSNNQNQLTDNSSTSEYSPQPTIIEAQTWKINQQGNIELLANIPVSDRPKFAQSKC